jgi:cellulose synthase/poly-beta-1,6-N-acetylglucosamine synthase-like glycosyltransferase
MKTLILVNSLVFAFSMSGILLVFLFTPLLVWIVCLIKGEKEVKYSTIYPSVSLITVVHNAEDSIVDKIRNSLSLNYSSKLFEIIFFSDGSTDKTNERLKPFLKKGVGFLSSQRHEGKYNHAKAGVSGGRGERDR